jgi:hypothetical protein
MPAARSFPLTWLTVADYKAWARIEPTDTADDAAIQECVDAATDAIETNAPRGFTYDPDTLDPEPVPGSVVEAGLLLTNRLMSRRNSPDGVVGVADMGAARIASYDADISGLLGPYTAVVLA